MPETLSCAVHQPNLFPRLSTLAKLARADVWVVLDDVQFNARDYQHRARLAAAADPEAQRWLTVPVHRPRGRDSRIGELRLADPAATHRTMSRLVRQYYGRCAHWAETGEIVEEVLAALALNEHLAVVAEVSVRAMLHRLGWRGDVLRSSELPARDGRSERLADLTAAVGASTYLCGPGGAKYLSERPFLDRGLQVRYPPPPPLSREPGMRTASALWAFAARGAAGVRDALAADCVPAR
ncbi:WbqC family protein [Amycolatopsis methanolica]|uniref:WbqC-like family protein n=1 Tax=Amycolatopsis methanolica 239 TaxID=1068978 RepID=A0A076MVF8_AMYME|nr:WbqC family protein [Amycolatopsis methanolica]AIJ22981.1 WbqC-like family protein [Amycolatopsis methanolica 239]